MGWLLAGDAIISVEPETDRRTVETSFLERSLPLLGRANRIWAKQLACEEWLALEPDWDVQVDSCMSRHKRLQRRFAKARRRKFAAAGVPRPSPAG